MSTTIINPEWLILDRTVKLLKSMAMSDEFVPSPGDPVVPADANSVLPWRTLEGHETNEQSGRLVNIPDPALLVTTMPVDGGRAAVNTADDEVITVVIQVVATSSGPEASQRPFRTYTDWMNRIRAFVLSNQNLFRQDFEPSLADPYLVMPRSRVPADPQRLYRHEQTVAAFSFYVKVRHYRKLGVAR